MALRELPLLSSLRVSAHDVAVRAPVVLLVLTVLWVIYTRFFHPLSHIPGPFWASVTRFWYVYKVSQGRMEQVQRALHQKHGPLVRIAPNEISCSDPDSIKLIYSTQSPLVKTDFYTAMANPVFSKHADHFTVTDERVHAERRKIVNHIYTLTSVLQQEKYINKCCELFVQKIGEFADSGKVMDLGQWLPWFTFDVIGELFFGRMFGFMANASDYNDFMYSLDTLLPLLSTVAVASKAARPFILSSALFSSSSRQAIKSIDQLTVATRASVAERQDIEAKAKANEGPEPRDDLLQQLMDIAHTKGAQLDFGIGEVSNEIYVSLTAGSESTAILLRAMFYYLMKNPEIYREVRQEIDDAAKRGELSDPPSYSEASKLPLVCGVVKEAMRLHPTAQLTLPRHAPPGGFEIAGKFIPGGWRIGVNAAVVGRDKDVYGEDANSFRPSRWQQGDTARMDRTILEFGSGTRTCIGRNVHKILPYILRNFDLEWASPDRDWVTRNHWLNQQSGMLVKVSRRE